MPKNKPSQKTLLSMAHTVLKRVQTSPERVEVLYKPSAKLKRLRRDPLLEDFANHLLQTSKLHLPTKKSQKPLHVRVAWNPALRSTAGMAFLADRLIILNPKLIEVSPGEVQRTLRHELAHILAQYRAGRRQIADHGEEWNQACSDLGIPNESPYHTLKGPLKVRRLKPKFFYECPECHSQISRVIALKTQAACIHCCTEHNEGKYSRKFQLRPVLLCPELSKQQKKAA